MLAKTHEYNRGARDSQRRKTNRYIKHIRYGNDVPWLDHEGHRPLFVDQDVLQTTNWMFEVVFDYGEGHFIAEAPTADEQHFVAAKIQLPDSAEWPVRQDPFSTYRAGFEVRTYRLCRRILMFHHFPDELNGEVCYWPNLGYAHFGPKVAMDRPTCCGPDAAGL